MKGWIIGRVFPNIKDKVSIVCYQKCFEPPKPFTFAIPTNHLKKTENRLALQLIDIQEGKLIRCRKEELNELEQWIKDIDNGVCSRS